MFQWLVFEILRNAFGNVQVTKSTKHIPVAIPAKKTSDHPGFVIVVDTRNHRTAPFTKAERAIAKVEGVVVRLSKSIY